MISWVLCCFDELYRSIVLLFLVDSSVLLFLFLFAQERLLLLSGKFFRSGSDNHFVADFQEFAGFR